MNHPLANLNEEELNQLLKAPVWITVLIASADGKIQKKELEYAEHYVKENAKVTSELQNYYEQVSSKFNKELKGHLILLSDDPMVRIELMEEQLIHLNEVISKIPSEFAIQLHKSWRDLAYGVAKAAGGFLGIGKIDEKESEYLQLNMIEIPKGEGGNG
jgi:Fe2+ transport system protein B